MTQPLVCGYTAPISVDVPRLLSPCDPASLTFDAVDPEELAHTLCASDHELFCRISPAELLDNAWSRPETKRQCRAVKAAIARSNALVRFCFFLGGGFEVW